MPELQWLLFMAQLPASPSSPRVQVWRRMRAEGAVGLQNGVWILPSSAKHASFMEELLAYVEKHEGSGQIFEVKALNQAVQTDLIEKFKADRGQEYAEFSERCQAFLAEIDKETSQKKFTFAELEENERDLEKLDQWLLKIQERDFFKGSMAENAVSELEQCRQALHLFTQLVYVQEGIEPDNEEVTGES